MNLLAVYDRHSIDTLRSAACSYGLQTQYLPTRELVFSSSVFVVQRGVLSMLTRTLEGASSASAGREGGLTRESGSLHARCRTPYRSPTQKVGGRISAGCAIDPYTYPRWQRWFLIFAPLTALPHGEERRDNVPTAGMPGVPLRDRRRGEPRR